jgi:hypothetical protein
MTDTVSCCSQKMRCEMVYVKVPDASPGAWMTQKGRGGGERGMSVPAASHLWVDMKLMKN